MFAPRCGHFDIVIHHGERNEIPAFGPWDSGQEFIGFDAVG